jgi:hypothetical protein
MSLENPKIRKQGCSFQFISLDFQEEFQQKGSPEKGFSLGV